MGIIGVGVGAAEMLPAMDSMPEIDLVACADIVPETRRRFKERHPEATTYDSAEALCAAPDVEAVWVSTPNQFHAPQAILAASHGKH
ncbi:MAG TPA: Gfo/Idh/MocA family oxidoreductase, partial [Chloroflexota bacterium]